MARKKGAHFWGCSTCKIYTVHNEIKVPPPLLWDPLETVKIEDSLNLWACQIWVYKGSTVYVIY